MVSDAQELQDIYAKIDRLEKGSISQAARIQAMDTQSTYSRFSLYPFFIILGLSCIFLAFVLDLIMIREIP